MARSYASLVAVFAVLLAAPLSASAARISCESRDYHRNYCPAGGNIASARLVVQQSRSACIQGRTWGYDNRGIWVTQGGSGEFDFRWSREPTPTPGPGRPIACESRNYQEAFCPVRPLIARAWLDEQRSPTTCIQGETWGFQGNGIWVNGGCSGVFAFQPQ